MVQPQAFYDTLPDAEVIQRHERQQKEREANAEFAANKTVHAFGFFEEEMPPGNADRGYDEKHHPDEQIRFLRR